MRNSIRMSLEKAAAVSRRLNASPPSQVRFRKVMIMVLWWAQKHFPVAVKLAVEDGAEFPEAIDGLRTGEQRRLRFAQQDRVFRRFHHGIHVCFDVHSRRALQQEGNCNLLHD